MDSSKALDLFVNRRDLLSSFLLEYGILLGEQPELTNVLSFEAYVQFSFGYYVAGEQRQSHERLQQEIQRLRDHLPLPVPESMRFKR